jgi:hypothetical protein
MRKKFLTLGMIVIAVFIAVAFITQGCSLNKVEARISNKDAILPSDIIGNAQPVADTFSWKTFIAMNWPANNNQCGPDTTNGTTILTGKGPVVWETYLSSDQVFVAPPASPDKWPCNADKIGTYFSRLPKDIQELAKKTGVYRFIHSTSKSPTNLDQASGGPLVDQNGRFVRYEVRMNQDEYNYIIKDTLWNTQGQIAFTKSGQTIAFPAGQTAYGANGAMEFKAAWKVLGKNDDSTKFYTIRAIVFNDDSLQVSPGPNPVTLGLVGLHIAHKTANQKNWVWSTFEQVDNLTKSFYDSSCKNCPVNQPLKGKNFKELNADGSPIHKPTQVTRVNPIENSNDSLNLYFQSLLKGSVWANYKLVSTQWILFAHMTPKFLANTVQETYLQGPHPASIGFKFPGGDGRQYFQDTAYHPFSNVVSSSCMGCHYQATLSKSNAKSDFSFLLGDAH